MSRAKIVLSFSPSGTSPRTIRWASPSTIAVLPTPGSPTSTGLFLVLRERIWITRRISESRPMTGSSRPVRAAATRSAPVLLQRLVRGLGRRAGHALGAAHLGENLQQPLALGAVLFAAAARVACLGAEPSIASRTCSTDTYSSFRRSASCSASSSSLRQSPVRSPAGPPAAPGPLTRGPGSPAPAPAHCAARPCRLRRARADAGSAHRAGRAGRAADDRCRRSVWP